MKLDLGAGGKTIEGFTPIDRRLGSEVYPLAFEDNSADEIRASHVLEHISHKQTKDVLKEWIRVLKPGGLLKIAVPNFDYAVAHQKHPHWKLWIMGGHADENDVHGAIFTPDVLYSLLRDAGLEDIKEWKSEIQDCAALPVSLNLCGRKPPAAPTTATPHAVTEEAAQRLKIGCALSLPRTGFTDTMLCLANALWALNVGPTRHYSSMWWERGLQTTLEDFIEDGFDFVVTADYDSVFTPEDLQFLIAFMVATPEADAACSLQPQRFSGNPMIWPLENTPTMSVKSAKPFQVKGGQFGLSVFRCSAFKDLPKPWFLNIPGDGGSWRREAPGLVDADMYFWNLWHKHGKTLFFCPKVSVGHLQTVVARIDNTGECVHEYPRDWINRTREQQRRCKVVKPAVQPDPEVTP